MKYLIALFFITVSLCGNIHTNLIKLAEALRELKPAPTNLEVTITQLKEELAKQTNASPVTINQLLLTIASMKNLTPADALLLTNLDTDGNTVMAIAASKKEYLESFKALLKNEDITSLKINNVMLANIPNKFKKIAADLYAQRNNRPINGGTRYALAYEFSYEIDNLT